MSNTYENFVYHAGVIKYVLFGVTDKDREGDLFLTRLRAMAEYLPEASLRRVHSIVVHYDYSRVKDIMKQMPVIVPRGDRWSKPDPRFLNLISPDLLWMYYDSNEWMYLRLEDSEHDDYTSFDIVPLPDLTSEDMQRLRNSPASDTIREIWGNVGLGRFDDPGATEIQTQVKPPLLYDKSVEKAMDLLMSPNDAFKKINKRLHNSSIEAPADIVAEYRKAYRSALEEEEKQQRKRDKEEEEKKAKAAPSVRRL